MKILILNVGSKAYCKSLKKLKNFFFYQFVYISISNRYKVNLYSIFYRVILL